MTVALRGSVDPELDEQISGSLAMVKVLGALGLIAFVLSAVAQIIGTGWVLRRFGLGAGLIILPVALLTSAKPFQT